MIRQDQATRPPNRRAKTGPLRLTIVHPCVGRRRNTRRYVRTWQMEPLPAAMIAALATARCGDAILR